MFKILKARLQHYVNQQLPNVQASFRKGRGPQDQIANICCIIEKQRSARKAFTSTSLTMVNPLTMQITTKSENSYRNVNTRPLYLPLEKPV